jgi:Mannosyl-glycoprotein endo-beta-N-acetylglucosaminidase
VKDSAMTSVPAQRQAWRVTVLTAFSVVALNLVGSTASAAAASLPEIRMRGSNTVPACVTPERLMGFLKTRNRAPDPRFAEIAKHYKKLGEGWRVRWDFAFFQMAVETNYLTYKQGNGRWGDVNPKQNNFAGIGTTGGGVPGDSFIDVKAGVLGHIQHLVAYSGERIVDPVAARTKLKQDDIIEASEKLNRPVTFQDLARRWAVDPAYGKSMAWVAAEFMRDHCKGGSSDTVRVIEASPKGLPEQLPWSVKPVAVNKPSLLRPTPKLTKLANADGPTAAVRTPVATPPMQLAAPKNQGAGREPKIVAVPAPASRQRLETLGNALVSPPTIPTRLANSAPALRISDADRSGLAAAANPASELQAQLIAKPAEPMAGPNNGSNCIIKAASYGGSKTVLIKSRTPAGEPMFVALGVLEGFEQSMTDSFLKSQPAGADVAGEFSSKSEALSKATDLCKTL